MTAPSTPGTSDAPGTVDASMFREYDIRGFVEQNFTAPVLLRLGRAFGTFLARQRAQRARAGRCRRRAGRAPLLRRLRRGLDRGPARHRGGRDGHRDGAHPPGLLRRQHPPHGRRGRRHRQPQPAGVQRPQAAQARPRPAQRPAPAAGRDSRAAAPGPGGRCFAPGAPGQGALRETDVQPRLRATTSASGSPSPGASRWWWTPGTGPPGRWRCAPWRPSAARSSPSTATRTAPSPTTCPIRSSRRTCAT